MFSYVKFSVANVVHIACEVSKICFLRIEKIVHETKFTRFERFLLLAITIFKLNLSYRNVYDKYTIKQPES